MDEETRWVVGVVGALFLVILTTVVVVHAINASVMRSALERGADPLGTACAMKLL